MTICAALLDAGETSADEFGGGNRLERFVGPRRLSSFNTCERFRAKRPPSGPRHERGDPKQAFIDDLSKKPVRPQRKEEPKTENLPDH